MAERLLTHPPEPAAPAGARHRDAGSDRRRWSRRSTAALVCVLAVVLLAVIPRLFLVDFGLPDINHPDEPTNITVGETMVRHGTLIPGRYNYPSFLFDLIAFVIKIAGLFGHELGSTPIVRQMGLFVARSPDPGMVLALRLCSVAGSLAMAAVVTVVLLRTTGSRTAALVGGGLLALSPTAIESGVYVTPDTWTGLFCALALAGALAVLHRGSLWSYTWCGLAIGLAFGAKYNAVLVALALLAAHLLRHRRASLRLRALGALALSTAAALVTTLVITPAWLVEPRRVWKGLSYEIMHYSHGQPGHEGSAPVAYARALLGHEPLLLVLALLGVGGLVLRRSGGRLRPEAVVVGSFAVAYLLLIGSQTVSFDRNLLPVLPALALLAGFGIATVQDRVAGRSRMQTTAAVALLAVAGLAMGVLSVVSTVLLHQRLQEPARAEAQRWVEAHLPVTAPIVEEASGPWLEPQLWTGVSPRFAAVDGQVKPQDVLILTEDVAGRYARDPHRYRTELEAYQRLSSTRCQAARFEGPRLWVQILVPCR